MKVINQKNENLWEEVTRSLEEHTAAGYKIACIEAEKVFKHLLKNKGYPINDLDQIITLFGWRLTDKTGLKSALKKTAQVKESFDYSLTSFEAEDIVESYRQAITDFSSKKALGWQRRLTLFYQNYLSLKTSFAKKTIFIFFVFFLLVKFLASTITGEKIVGFFVSLADLIFSWTIVLAIILVGLIIFIIFVFTILEKKRTRIRSIDEKNS